jgi:hypothetical protein
MGLIVADEEFFSGAARIQDISEELLEINSSFNKIIDKLISEGICDLLVNNHLIEIETSLSMLSSLLTEIASNIVEHTNCFINEIDDAEAYFCDCKR